MKALDVPLNGEFMEVINLDAGRTMEKHFIRHESLAARPHPVVEVPNCVPVYAMGYLVRGANGLANNSGTLGWPDECYPPKPDGVSWIVGSALVVLGWNQHTSKSKEPQS